MQPSDDESTRKIVSYYSDSYQEQDRLARPWGQVEFARTQTLIRPYLKRPPAVVYDVGGAAGRYACWLAQEGYTVHLIDPVPLHVQQAQAASAAQPAVPLASCVVGDARQLQFEDNSADAVLLLGPLYHLVEVEDRQQALAEAYRVLKPGGSLFAAGISRFASTMDGLASGLFLDPAFREIMLRDLEDGRHQNPTQNAAYFMDTFFHHPDELKAEVAQVGFQVKALSAIEGISYMVKDFDQHWANEGERAFLLDLLRKLEQEPSLMGASPHILCAAVKP